MSKTSSDPEKYYRTGIAIPVARKAIFDARLAELGLKTVGDLTTLFITMPGVIEALGPIAEKFHEHRKLQKDASPAQREVMEHMKKLSPQEINALLHEVRAKAQTPAA